MIVESKELKELLENAIKRAREKKENILLSYVKEIEANSPIDFFSQASSFKGSRFFWSNSTRNHFLVGLGHAYEINNNFSQQRFWKVQKEWNKLLGNHITNIEQKKGLGVGPLIFGGFSFDPEKEKTSLWRNYEDAKMLLPSFMLTVVENKHFLTINIIIDENDKLEDLLHNILEKEKIIFSEKRQSQSQVNNIIKQEDVNIDGWLNAVAEIISEIKLGYVKKVVLARELRLTMKEKIDVTSVLIRLLEEQAKSYIFALEYKNDCFLGATPELLVKKEEREFTSMCLAGTTARGSTYVEDEKLGNELLDDHKNLYEHALVVEMIKEVMEKHCLELDIAKWPILYNLKNVKHLYTPVKGIGKEGVSLLEMLEGLHPTPALGGYPKEMSMAMIRKNELLDRGWYAAPIGWMDADSDGEFVVAIRSSLIQGSKASLFAGGGIVEESQPTIEFNETKMKFEAMLSAFRGYKHEKI